MEHSVGIRKAHSVHSRDHLHLLADFSLFGNACFHGQEIRRFFQGYLRIPGHHIRVRVSILFVSHDNGAAVARGG